ncbi:Mobile element protein [Candidatus Enterovibrio altilux]|uniref:Mobile element protein n=1 Tax=Candidatus Enterovibrio altilux TaxID=1927128 RepID=A0A291BBB4_9GAMM|nr:Mobile element protein [Candidatus Enterovibrio luxaltus]
MSMLHYKIANWKQFNQVLINFDSLICWIDKKFIQLWNKTKQVIMENFVYLATCYYNGFHG